MSAVQPITQFRATPARFTADEFAELMRHPPISHWIGKVELVEGEIVRMSPANIPHWSVLRSVFLQLNHVLVTVGTEWLVGPEPAVRLGDGTVRSPDVGVFRDPDMSGKVFAVADLFIAVEVADTSLAFDLGEKLRDYAGAGVPHYWVVDINNRRTLGMTAPDGECYTVTAVTAFGEPLTVPGTNATITIA